PDIVGLQEVVRGAGPPPEDQAAYLARALGMELVMGETRSLGDGTFGNAVLTRLRVLGSDRCDLSQAAREPRGCLRVDLAVDGIALHLFNCHLGLSPAERRRRGRRWAVGRSASSPGARVTLDSPGGCPTMHATWMKALLATLGALAALLLLALTGASAADDAWRVGYLHSLSGYLANMGT